MAIFLDDEDYRQFAFLLGDVCEKFAIECCSYCTMPNHYHVALLPHQPNLSNGMQRLNGEYAQWWNRKRGRVGHLFQGRFKDQIVQRDAYLLTLLRYIALNPVRAGLVDSPDKWRWGSYPALAGLEPAPPFLSVSTVLSAFGDGERGVLSGRFVRYIREAQAGMASLEDRLRSKERVLGDRAFKERVLADQGVKDAA